jgi:hypothetical protein
VRRIRLILNCAQDFEVVVDAVAVLYRCPERIERRGLVVQPSDQLLEIEVIRSPPA